VPKTTNDEDQEMAEAKFYGERDKALACQQEVSVSHKRPIISSMHLVFQNNLAGDTVYHYARAIPGDW
jgi:hypothetical protein